MYVLWIWKVFSCPPQHWRTHKHHQQVHYIAVTLQHITISFYWHGVLYRIKFSWNLSLVAKNTWCHWQLQLTSIQSAAAVKQHYTVHNCSYCNIEWDDDKIIITQHNQLLLLNLVFNLYLKRKFIDSFKLWQWSTGLGILWRHVMHRVSASFDAGERKWMKVRKLCHSHNT